MKSQCECESEGLRPVAEADAEANSQPKEGCESEGEQPAQKGARAKTTPAPEGLNVCSPGQGREAEALG